MLQELLKRINLTSHLALMSLVIALAIAIPVGVLSAVRQDTVADYLGRLLAILGLSLPDFWLATVVITFLAIWLRWIPPIGLPPSGSTRPEICRNCSCQRSSLGRVWPRCPCA